MNRRDVVLGMASATAGLAAPRLARAAELLKVAAFAGASNLPIWTGLEKGFFAKENVAPVLEITPGSIQLAKDLHEGRIDLALTAIDNIVAYDEGQGEVDLGGPANFVALFGIDNGMLSLMVAPDIQSIADLKGKALGVDALTTGYAMVQREILARNGITDKDVTLMKVGGGAQRLEALLKGEQKGTMLNTPLDLIAEAKGFKRLVRAKDVLGAYQGISAATTRDMLGKKRDTIAAFTRGFHTSIAWVATPANRDEAIGLLVSKMKGMERPAAERSYDKLFDATDGIYRDLKIDMAGMKTVLELRSKYAEPKKQLTDASKYIDAGFLSAALKG